VLYIHVIHAREIEDEYLEDGDQPKYSRLNKWSNGHSYKQSVWTLKVFTHLTQPLFTTASYFSLLSELSLRPHFASLPHNFFLRESRLLSEFYIPESFSVTNKPS
jgi:hypothetical protein